METMAKKQYKIVLKNVMAQDQWNEMMYEFFFDSFEKENPHLDPKNSHDDENEIVRKFHEKFILPNFKINYGHYNTEMADLELLIDQDLNVVSGKIIKPKTK